MQRHSHWAPFLCIALLGVSVSADAASYTIVGWNNLGMHCMDGDFSVLSLLPPYNTIHAQVIDPTGAMVTDPAAAGILVTYEAIADGTGSINTTSQGKSNFWQYALPLFGGSPPPDVGLTGVAMPGPSNTAQPMTWDAASGWFVSEGIPITPYDDTMQKNPYPMMRLVARTSGGAVLAYTDIVLPVSDEMDCKGCHSPAAGTPAPAMPQAGWVSDPDAERETRLNIVRKHDELQADNPTYATALAAGGFNASGLYANVTIDGKPVLCASCHASAALGTSGHSGVAPLTQAMHGGHAGVEDPQSGQPLDASTNRSACYSCHPGAETRCLRGVMGTSVSPDGSLAIQCQECHGSMREVGAPGRLGWLEEPLCQSCHTGTATHNSGALRYNSVFDSPGHVRDAVDATFSTTPDVPAAGLSLYRFSTGHGGLKCEACHGSTHAEVTSIHANDNVQNIEIQGHEGVLIECGSCHGGKQPATIDGGPHGMHPVGQAWVNDHHDLIDEHDTSPCRDCHGLDYRGTVLSRAKATRTLTGEAGTKHLWPGFQIGCYTCHLGPHEGDPNSNHAAVADDDAVSATSGVPRPIALVAKDADGDALALRIVSQPVHGTAGLDGAVATYVSEPGFSGADSFTFAAWDGATDSNLATVTVEVSSGVCGDVNGDGERTAGDALGVLRAAVGIFACAPEVCDFNGSGVVTATDALAVLRDAVGLPSEPACP